MAERSTEALVRELSCDLAPVRRIPRLRVLLAAVFAVQLAALALEAVLGGPLPRAGSHWWEPAFLAVIAGLAALAAGALLATFASAVPGRDGPERAGRALVLAGGLVVLAGALVGLLADDRAPSPGWLQTGLSCLLRGGWLGLAPALAVAALVARGLPRPGLARAALAVLGAMALASAFVHASCPLREVAGLHALLGHALAPFAIAVTLAGPLALWVRRSARRGAA